MNLDILDIEYKMMIPTYVHAYYTEIYFGKSCLDIDEITVFFIPLDFLDIKDSKKDIKGQ